MCVSLLGFISTDNVQYRTIWKEKYRVVENDKNNLLVFGTKGMNNGMNNGNDANDVDAKVVVV